MNFKLETEFSKAEVLQEVDALKKQIDDMRPLPPDIEGKVMQKLRLDWNYHSNAIEGNRLSYGETIAFLMEGITAKGKPLKDHLDIRGHNEAINFLLSIVKDTRPISESDIRSLHAMILVEPYEVNAQTPDGLPTTKRITLGEYKTSPNHVETSTGEIHYYAAPGETPVKMQELIEWYIETTNDKTVHPLVIAALFHHKFVSIHPFDDGNGRLSRILMNLILMQNGYPPVVIKMDDRQNYYSLLSRADKGDSWPFVDYIVERLEKSLQLFLKAAIGEDINEDEDIDKEIALFKWELYENTVYKKIKSKAVINKVLKDLIQPLTESLFITAEKFNDLFLENKKWIILKTNFGRSERTERFQGFNKSLYNFINFKYEGSNKGEFITDAIELHFIYYEFKSPIRKFNLKVEINISFNGFNFEVFDGYKNILLTKLYHENISQAESKLLSKKLVENIKSSIKEKLEEEIPLKINKKKSPKS